MPALLSPPHKGSMGRSRKEVDTSTYTGRFAVRLRMLREKAGLSVEELAEKTGIPASTLYDWENTRRIPSIDKLPALSDSLGVTIASILPKG